MKFAYFLVLTWIGLFQSASAQTMKAINLEPGDKLINQGVNISIDFTSEKKPWCGLRVDWGNGKTQPVRVGHDGDEGAPTSPIKLSNTYNTAGKYNISVKGELLVRGLTGTAMPCEVKTSAAEVVVIDPVADSQFIQKAWITYLASLESRPLQLQCVKIGVPALGIKIESAVAGDKLTSMETPVAKTLIERCLAFQQAKKPEINGSCKIASGNNYFDSNCDGYYAEKQADGALKSITIEDAITLHVQGKPWIVGLLETDAGKAARLANENALKEKEKQRVLELLRIWKDTGYAVSQLPSCPTNGGLNNCFGSGKDSNGNEYIGEFNNSTLVSKGVIHYKNGDKYVGEYDGRSNGEGIVYYLAENQYKGMIFVGHFKNNAQTGNGIYFDRNGNVVETGLYENNKLVEYRYVDPASFSRIPSGKIPVITADARLKIEGKQAEIAKKEADRQRAAAQAAQDAREREERRQREIAENQERERREFAANFPFRAEFSCLIGNNDQEFGIFQCLNSKYMDGTLEINNGADYSFFKSRDLIQYNQVPNVIVEYGSNILKINLKKQFAINLYSPNDTFITGLKIINNATEKVVWQKKVSKDWIKISNN